MEPLSSFAISLAAGIAIDFYNHSQSSVKKELKSAFEQALKVWCKNDIIREKKRVKINRALIKLLDEPEKLSNIQFIDSELISFFKIYEEVLAEFKSAFNYIKEVKDIERFKKEIELLHNIRDSIKDLNDKVDFLKDKLQSLGSGLEKEWIRQLEVYKTSIQEFKPKTALDFLLKLEESFTLTEIKPSRSIKATVEFLKGQCYEFIGNMSEMHKCYINSYRLDNSSLNSKEKACFSFYINKKHGEAKKVIEEIVQFDEFNSIAWAVKVLISESTDLIKLLESVPEIVREDDNFKRIIYSITRHDSKYINLFEAYEKYSILPTISEWDKTPLSFNNYKGRVFLIEATLYELFKTIYIDFNRVYTGDIQIIISLHSLIGDFLNQLEESEILQNFSPLQFYYEYFDFIIKDEKDAVIRMKSIYPKFNNEDGLHVMILSNCLLQINKVDDAINIINNLDQKSLELLHFEAFCYLKKNDLDNYIKYSKEYLLLTKRIDLESCQNILTIPISLAEYGRIDSISLEDFIKGKDFEFDYLKSLIEILISILLKNTDSETVQKLKEIEPAFLKSKSVLIFYISFSYFSIEEYELAIELFRKYGRKDIESRDLFIYIKSLDKAAIYNKELLKLLKFWRENFSFNEELLQIEADLRQQLSDWENCVTISEYFLSIHENEESFLTLYLVSISESSMPNKAEKIKKLATIFSAFDFKNKNHVPIVSRILFQFGYYKIALNILYRFAIIKENKQARMDYFSACINLPDDLINEKPVVEKGLFVKYELNNEIQFIEIDDSNTLAKSLIGLKVGDTIRIERPMIGGFDTVKILRIMDKFLYLHDEILEEVKNNPYSGIPMQSVEFKDTSPEGLVQTLKSLFGPSGTVIKENRKNAFLQYYKYQLSYSEIVLQNYSSDYIGGYFDLIHRQDGFTVIPDTYYPKVEIAKFNNVVIDFTSLLILFQISREHEINFNHKFIISKGILDYIKAFKKKESANITDQLSVDISMDGVTKSTKPENVFKSNIQYLINLIEWVETNCIIKIAESRLNVTRKLNGEIKNELFAKYVLDNISLVQEHENCLLISDDSIHLKFFPIKSGKIISSELFVASHYGANTSIMTEFVNNKYIGITISKEMLIIQFNKKLKGQINNYTHSLNNLSLSLNPKRENMYTAIKFLKEISMTSLIPLESLKREATGVFVALLKGQTNWKTFSDVEVLLRKEFKLLGTKLYVILESFENSIFILNVSRH